jgi:hypothetical protein
MNEQASYRKINYAIRPGKNIQRKMISEMCSCLKVLRRLNTYRYIGFGSTFFSDFSLFHRRLGFRNMISIEKELGDRERFEFNRPLGCIKLKFGESTDILSELDWTDIPSIVWMDYDTQLDKAKMDDTRFLAENLSSESFLIVTLRAVAQDFGGNTEKRLLKLKSDLGDRMPHDIRPRDFVANRLPHTLRYIIYSNIQNILSQRNAALPEGSRFVYKQLLNSVYDDGTRMLTVGGILIQESQLPNFSHCDFNSLDFYREAQEYYLIRVPSLTYKERRHLDAQLPSDEASSPGVSEEDVREYDRLSRYFPWFVEAEL